MSLAKRQALQKQGYLGQMKIRETERLSIRPFGRLSSKAAFVMDVDKVPFYNIPDLTGFEVSVRGIAWLNLFAIAITLRISVDS